jgi:hypothetical protein
MAWLMGTAAPGTAGIAEVVAGWQVEVVGARPEVRSHRPSTRPTTLKGVAFESTDRTGEPL